MRVLIRADASRGMGAGHVLRCLALAQAIIDERLGEVVFAMHAPPAAIRERIAREGLRLVTLSGERPDAALASVVMREKPDVVVLDGYHLGASDRRAATLGGAALVMIDDNHEVDTSGAALVVNPGPHAEALSYGATPSLLGLQHALLRRDLRAAASRAELFRADAPVLVTLGGSDPRELTVPIVERLIGAGVPVHVLLGGLALDATRTAVAALGATLHVDVDDVVPLFDRVGWAFSAAGGTAWELAALGHPVASIAVAPNQRAAAQALAAPGRSVGPSCDVCELDGARLASALDAWVAEALLARSSAEATRRHAAAARSRVDGRGAVRVAHAIANLAQPSEAHVAE